MQTERKADPVVLTERTCDECGGPLMVLGQLGSQTHGRCRDCGLQWSWVEPVTVRILPVSAMPAVRRDLELTRDKLARLLADDEAKQVDIGTSKSLN